MHVGGACQRRPGTIRPLRASPPMSAIWCHHARSRCMHNVSSARKRHGEEMPRYTALSTAEELAASCQPRRHAPHAGGLLPRLFGHLLFCYTCVMSTLLCPLLAVVVRPFAPLLPRPIRGASLFRLVALIWHWSLGIQPLPPLEDAGDPGP